MFIHASRKKTRHLALFMLSSKRVQPTFLRMGGSKRLIMLSSSRSDRSNDPENTQSLAWQAQKNSEIQRVTQKAIIHELTQQQSSTIEEVVPWFLSNMPVSLSEKSMNFCIYSALSILLDKNRSLVTSGRCRNAFV